MRKKSIVLLIVLLVLGLAVVSAQSADDMVKEIENAASDYMAGRITREEYTRRITEIQQRVRDQMERNLQQEQARQQQQQTPQPQAQQRTQPSQQQAQPGPRQVTINVPRAPQGVETQAQAEARLMPYLEAARKKHDDLFGMGLNAEQLQAESEAIQTEMKLIQAELHKASIAATPRLNPPPGMVRINGGTFTMGSPVNEPERERTEVQHQVTLSPFLMGRYEVTHREWIEVMEIVPSTYYYPARRDLYGRDGNLPVERVHWLDAIEYCNRLSRKEGLTPCYTVTERSWDVRVTWNRQANGYRLPTEAEWEYACRAGTTTPFNTGNTITIAQANVPGRVYNNSHMQWDEAHKKPVAVGSYAPNAWGLYDMHGNVWEYCFDTIDYRAPYPSQPRTNPVMDNSEDAARVIRGGGWENKFTGGFDWRSATRGTFVPRPDRTGDMNGFRVVRNAQ